MSPFNLSTQIVPGASNEVAIDLIATHIRRQMNERALRHRKGLTDHPGLPRTSSGSISMLPDTVTVLEQTPQIIVRLAVWVGVPD